MSKNLQFSALVGLQFGDEGKGKIVDLLSSSFDYVIRYQGGDNAGHTIYHQGEKFVLRTIPSGIFNTSAIIAPGVTVNPFLLLEEISTLEKLLGHNLKGKLFIALQSNVIFDFHIEWDKLCEKLRGCSKIGSTLRGIGPAYADKSARLGLKFVDLFNKDNLKEKLEMNLRLKNPVFEKYGCDLFESNELAERYFKVAEQLKDYFVDYYSFISKEISSNKSFLLEGSQGILLDIDLGTYPFVTSSNIVSSIYHGAYLPVNSLGKIMGACKVYTSRVGSGPLPTEFKEEEKEIEELIREKGREYGSNTVRARRLGWLDLSALKYSIALTGVTELTLSLVDVFVKDNFPKFKVCIGYKNQNNEKVSFSEIVGGKHFGKEIIPVYKEFECWNDNYSKITKFADFSTEFRNFVEFLESELSIRISLISFGKNKDDHVFRD
ncbi:adenylosuccinate synthase [Mycoplasma ovis str. Michigan]|uniref:Adenylosuccinate synthetase n=1 Tax=Mycoplasma ovis str. Michigan TaxID=1415773 RepID=A0ABM5P0A3_9MOLU|nr:adenylosuccinate synthase [Mycoplasma ovis]AHC39842.1 adenylosuccinate synthase [Mycoplasma ovis str. Michigan]